MTGFAKLFVALSVFCTISVHSVSAFKSCTSPRPVFNDGLCYKGCPPGLSGSGPLCWAATKCGPNHTDTGAFCNKNSYGRGVGKPLRFFVGPAKSSRACSATPKCKSGYKGVGPVCWTTCPSGYCDDGAFCAKPACGHGVESPLVLVCHSNE